MPTARMNGRECEVRLTEDPNGTWSVEVAPKLATPRKSEPLKPAPAAHVVKLHADNAESAARIALETLKQAGKIEDFTA